MKRFLLQTGLFFVGLVILNQIPPLFISPSYGNRIYEHKYRFFLTHADEYNSVVMGSSRIYSQVDPGLFDSLLRDHHFRTFNLGATGIYNPECYFLYEKLLEHNPGSLKYAFLELQPLASVANVNLRSPRHYYWHNTNFLIFSTRYLLSSPYTSDRKRKTFMKYLISYTMNVLSLSKYKLLGDKKGDDKFLGKSRDGFRSLEDEAPQRVKFESFKTDTTTLTRRIATAKREFAVSDHTAQVNKVHLAKLQYLIDQSAKKGIHLIFLIPPKRDRYAELLALKEQLPGGRVIEIADYETYPQLYLSRNAFDTGHLNDKGASLFTTYLAERVDEVLMDGD